MKKSIIISIVLVIGMIIWNTKILIKPQNIEFTDEFYTDEEFFAAYPILKENNHFAKEELKNCNESRKLLAQENFEECITSNNSENCVNNIKEFYDTCFIRIAKVKTKNDTYYFIFHSADYCGSAGCGLSIFSKELNDIIFFDNAAYNIKIRGDKFIVPVKYFFPEGGSNFKNKIFSLKKIKRKNINKRSLDTSK
jgi:hypothetical protein